jgi:hypothetical protein
MQTPWSRALPQSWVRQGHGGRASSAASHTRSPSRPVDSSGHLRCQICLHPCHTSNICWKRFDEDYVLELKTTTAASTSHGTNPNCYLYSEATDHITRELNKLMMHDRYHGNDQVQKADGVGMHINCISNYVIPTAHGPLYLTNILHVPRAHKHLVLVHHFNIDNHTFIELHPYFFLIKDQVTRKVLLDGPCKGGIYPLSSSLPPSLQKFASTAIKLSPDCWHNRLGHPSHDIVCCVLRDNNFLCSTDGLCSYPISSSHSSAPLDLVFSDLWGHAIDSFGGKKYYVILLTILVNLLGSISFTANLKFSMSSSNLSNTCSTKK